MTQPSYAITAEGWTLDGLLAKGKRFRRAVRISVAGLEDAHIARKISEFEADGVPTVLEDWHKHDNWLKNMFTVDNFVENSSKNIHVRNVRDWSDKTMDLSEFVDLCRATLPITIPGETQRCYGKDAECPGTWKTWLSKGRCLPRNIAPNSEGDVFRFRPPSSPVETLMCYLGIGDTYTPCHKDLCASSGHNLMCYTEDGGSSIWFMTKSSDAIAASAYFHSLGQELDHENHVISVKELARAPFDVYILQQRLGDLVLVPPRSCHQVVNMGGLAIKTSWSRMTVHGLVAGYFHELPIYRRVCRPEVYRVKSTTYYTLIAQTLAMDDLLQKRVSQAQKKLIMDLFRDLTQLLSIFDAILADEYSGNSKSVSIENLEEEISCDFCGGDIFTSYFDCNICSYDFRDPFIICPNCYVEGRSCRCTSMEAKQYRDFEQLLHVRGDAVEVMARYAKTRSGANRLPPELDLESFDRHPMAFRAALQMHSSRARGNSFRRCVMGPQGPHSVLESSWSSCRKCHRGICHPHFLQHSKVHAQQSLLLCEADGTHGLVHKKHLESRTSYPKDDLLALQELQIEDGQPDHRFQLACLALNFKAARPLRPRFAQGGFYDELPEAARPLNEPLSLRETTRGRPLSKRSRSITPSTSTLTPTPSPEPIPLPPRRPHSTKTFFVDVPPAPYPTPRTLERPISRRPRNDNYTNNVTETNSESSTWSPRSSASRDATKSSIEEIEMSLYNISSEKSGSSAYKRRKRSLERSPSF